METRTSASLAGTGHGPRCSRRLFALAATLLAAGLCAAPQGAAAQEHQWIAATAVPPDDAIAQALDFFAGRVEELSGGEIVIDTHHGGSLGGDRDLVENVRQGAIQLAVPGQAILAGWYKPAEIWTFPYLFKDVAHKDRVWDAIKDEYAEEVAREAGLRPLVGVPRAPRMLTANKVVRTPEDMKGLKIRVPETPMWRATFERFGASPTPLPFPEVYQALHSGVIDGQENPVALSWTSGFFDINTHLNLTEHMMQDNVIVIGEPVYQQLSPEQKQVLEQAADETEKKFRQVVAEQDAVLLQQVKDKGVVVTPVDKEAFKATVQGMENEFPHVKEWYARIAQIQ